MKINEKYNIPIFQEGDIVIWDNIDFPNQLFRVMFAVDRDVPYEYFLCEADISSEDAWNTQGYYEDIPFFELKLADITPKQKEKYSNIEEVLGKNNFKKYLTNNPAIHCLVGEYKMMVYFTDFLVDEIKARLVKESNNSNIIKLWLQTIDESIYSDNRHKPTELSDLHTLKMIQENPNIYSEIERLTNYKFITESEQPTIELAIHRLNCIVRDFGFNEAISKRLLFLYNKHR